MEINISNVILVEDRLKCLVHSGRTYSESIYFGFLFKPLSVETLLLMEKIPMLREKRTIGSLVKEVKDLRILDEELSSWHAQVSLNVAGDPVRNLAGGEFNEPIDLDVRCLDEAKALLTAMILADKAHGPPKVELSEWMWHGEAATEHATVFMDGENMATARQSGFWLDKDGERIDHEELSDEEMKAEGERLPDGYDIEYLSPRGHKDSEEDFKGDRDTWVIRKAMLDYWNEVKQEGVDGA